MAPRLLVVASQRLCRLVVLVVVAVLVAAPRLLAVHMVVVLPVHVVVLVVQPTGTAADALALPYKLEAPVLASVVVVG